MGKTITVSDDAYARLLKHKKAGVGDSFTKVILECIPDPDRPLSEIAEQIWSASPKPRRRRRHARSAA